MKTQVYLLIHFLGITNGFSQGIELYKTLKHSSLVYSVHISPDGKYLLTGSGDRNGTLWDLSNGEMMRDLGVLGGANIQFSGDGKYVSGISGNTMSDLSFKLVEVPSGTVIQRFNVAHNDGVTGVQVGRVNNAAVAVTSSRDHTAKVWDIVSGNLIMQLSGHDKWVNSAQISHDGKSIVTASGDYTTKIWDAISGKVLMTLTHDKTVNYAEFSRDGKFIVTASFDNIARVWEAATGLMRQELKGHKSILYTARFSLDSRYVVTASDDKTAKVWETATGNLISTINGHTKEVYSAAFSPDGKYIVTASSDKTARIWKSSVTSILIPQSVVQNPALSPSKLTTTTLSSTQQSSNNSSTTNQVQAGTVVSNAKVLPFKTDYPSMGEFHDGFAVLRDGDLTALINEKGDMVFPYGKYSAYGIPANGYIPANDAKKGRWGILNYKGEVVVPFESTSQIESISDDGYYRINDYENRSVKGNIFKLEFAGKKGDTTYTYYYGQYSEGLCSFSSDMHRKNIGFINKKGEIVIKPQPFSDIGEFSEGLAVAGKLDEVGQTKYGFINTKGDVVVPFNFSNKPGPFKNGLSHVQSKNGEHAWIDKEGNFKFKMSDFPDWSNSGFPGWADTENSIYDFVNSVIPVTSPGKKGWLNVTGKIIPVLLSYTSNENGQTKTHTEIYFGIQKVTKGQMLIKVGDNKGILDGEGNLIVPPIFDELGFFDPTSGLAKAILGNGKEKIEGYINRNGIFVIVKGKSSEW